jgi:peroxiredoxin
MVAVPSTMLALGTLAPDFALPDVVSGRMISPGEFGDRKGLLIMFLSRHCPYVQHVKDELARIGRDYGASVGIVAISSNDVANYPDDAPDKLAQLAKEAGFAFPICFDETQEVAKAYSAACTPDFFLFNGARELIYRGQLDESRPGNQKPVTGRDLRAALDCLLDGRPAPEDQRPSLGCNIKWKPGNEPTYFR